MAGATGLDYASVWAVIDRQIKPRQRQTAFYLIQAMEDAALQEWRARDERNK